MSAAITACPTRLVQVAILMVTTVVFVGCDQEPSAWSAAKSQNTAEAYEIYLKEHAAGRHATEAKQLLAERHEDSDWAAAKTANSIESLEAFLARYPKTTHSLDAQQMLVPLREFRDWAKIASGGDGPQALKEFISRNPASAHLAEAQQLLVAHDLSTDAAALLRTVGDGFNGAVGIPGSIYTLGTDLPFIENRPVQLITQGEGTLSCIGLKGGAFRILQDRRMCLFGPVKMVVRVKGKDTMTVFGRVADTGAVLDLSGPGTAMAVVKGVAYTLAGDGRWRLAATSQSSSGDK